MKTGEEIDLWPLDKFEREIFSLNPNGDLNLCFTTATLQARSLHNPLPFNELRTKYLEYIQSKAQLQNGKFTKSEDRIVDIHNFISSGLWKKKFGDQIQKIDPRTDYYLFGPDIINN
jgi:hypothetical protein